jgi:hypothetical protein
MITPVCLCALMVTREIMLLLNVIYVLLVCIVLKMFATPNALLSTRLMTTSGPALSLEATL